MASTRSSTSFSKKPSLITGTDLIKCQKCGEHVFAPPEGRMAKDKTCTPCDKGWR